MDSYNFHFERMNNLDLHPLSLPVNRLSPAKSSSSIDQFTHHHHQHGKGDSAYSSFSGGSNAPDPSPFLPEDLQSSSLHYTDLKYVKAIYHPSQLLQSDARSMDQLYRSVEAFSKQYHHNNKDNNSSSRDFFMVGPSSNQEEAPPAPPPLPPPPPTRLDSFIATRNLENSRAHHGPEGQRPSEQHALRVLTANPQAGCLRSDPIYAWRSSQPFHREPLNPDHTDKTTEKKQKSANILSRLPPQGTSQPENLKHKQHTASKDGSGGHFEGPRKRAHSAHGSLMSASPMHVAQNLINSSIQHKGQFYFVTGVCKSSESGRKNVSPCVSEAGSETSTVVETHRLVEREKENERERSHSVNMFRNPHQRHQGSLDTTTDEREYLTKTQSQEEENHSHISRGANLRTSHSFDALEQSHKSLSREIGRHHSSNHPIFYCGPEENSPPLCTLPNPSHNTEITPLSVEQGNQHKREDQGKRGRRQLLGDVASEKINKETTPLLYHLTGAGRVALKPKKDVDISVKGKETSHNAAHQDTQASLSCNDRPSQSDVSKEERVEVSSHPCNNMDDSFKKYYKEKLKDAQSKVLRETSFKRKDLQLSWPHRVRPRPELRPTVLHSVSSSQDSETSTDTLTPSLPNSDGTERLNVKEEVKDSERESVKEDKKNRRPVNVAQPQVARIGGRKRLTPEQKKLCYSEPENLNQLGDAPSHSSCRSLGNEMEGLLSGEEELGEHGEEGLVAARRKMFETRGRALSASSLTKTNLKHLQHKALVAYMERKTGQKLAEPQQPAPQVPPSQRHSTVGKPSDWGLRPQASGSKSLKKKLHRPHSAGRILDSSFSSIRYSQFSSAQSCSGQSGGHSRQSSWRDTPSPAQLKSASVESLLDQPEPPEFFRNRSTSTPHAFQVHSYAKDPSPINLMETSSLQRTADEKELQRPGQVPLKPSEDKRVRVVAQRGKSMEELGVSKDTMPLVLSKSSEQLDQFRRRQDGQGWDKRNVTLFREGQEGKPQGQESVDRGKEEDAETQKQHLFKQNSAPQLGSEEDSTPMTRGPTDSSRSISPGSSCSSQSRAHSGSPETYGSGPSVSDKVGACGPPSEPSSPPMDQETSEKEIKTTSSSPASSQQSTVQSESKNTSRLRMTPPVTSEEREQSVDEPSDTFPSETNQEVSLSCGVTTDPSLWVFLPEPGSSSTEDDEVPLRSDTVPEGHSPLPTPMPQAIEPPTSPNTPAPDADTCQSVKGQGEEECPRDDEANDNEGEGESPGGEAETTPPLDEPRWEELVEEVVSMEQSLASVLYPLTNRKTALMLMEQLLSEDTLLMEEHYKKKQEQREAADSSETGDDVEPPPFSSSCSSSLDSENSQPPEAQNKSDVTEKKRLLVSRIEERLRSLEESQGALQVEVAENRVRGQAMEALVQEHCQPMELERYTLFIGDLERVVSLLLCLSARLARVQNALSTVNQHTDAEDKQSLDNRHRLLCKQRDDAKDLKDNLDRRERLVSTFLSRQLSSEQLQDYRHFVQTKASLLIRLKDLEEKQRLGEEQLEALLNSLPL